MNSDDLRVFSLVADSGSISAAAISGGCDTSTVSRQIAQLEKSLGTRLFSRGGRGVTLTPQGQVLLSYAREVASLLDSARAAMNSNNQQGPARIRIAAQPTIAKVMFGALFHAIHDRYPSSQLQFIEGSASALLAELHTGGIDIAVLYRPEYPGALAYEPLLFERLYLLTPANSGVTAEQVRADGLAGIPLVLPSTHHGLRVLVEAMAARLGYEPTIVLQNDSSIALRLDLVAKGCGCTVLPLAAAEADIAAGRLKGFPLEEQGSERCIVLVLGKTDIPSTDLWVLNGFVRDIATQLVTAGEWHGARLPD
jgi:DNA-binding transcriptional LysR family regulator